MHNSVGCRYLTTLLAFCILAAAVPTSSPANELLRITGMGGTRIATYADDAGIFGNPASLVHTKHHNVALGVALENFHWAELPKSDTEQFVTEANIDVSPALYYSKAFRKWGMSAGYTARSTNFANFTFESTDAEYNRNLRQFSAKTDLITDYDLFQERNWVLGYSREFGKLAAGARLKWINQTIDRGTTISTLNLEARHGPEVDVEVPEELIEAIFEELQFGDRVRDIVHVKRPTLERTVSQLELDIGFQTEVWLDAQHTNSPLLVGVLFENLLQADLVEPLPLRFGIGVAYEPLEWITVAADISRATGQRAGDYAAGAEFHKTWKNGYSVAFRIGLRNIETLTHFTAGTALVLGTLSTEYTLSRPLTDLPIAEARHLLGLTLRL